MNMDTKDKVIAFFEKYPLKKYSTHELLIRPDEPIDFISYIVEGRVSQYDITSSGNEIVVNVFKPGAFFPMSSAINHTANQYFFEASLSTTAHVAPASEVINFLQSNPDVLLDLLARVYRGVDGVLRRMAHLMGGSAHNRLIFELLNAANRFGEINPDGTTFIPLSEGTIAKHSGLARETVSRLLQKLKTDQFIEITHNGILIKNMFELESQLGKDV